MPNIRISDMAQATTPLVGDELMECVQGGFSRQVTVDEIVASAVELDATFVTVTANPNLDNERVLTAGLGIGIVDSGAGNAITVSLGTVTLPLLGDINTATPPVAEAITSLLEFRDAQNVNIIGTLGYNGDNHLVLQNEMRGGDIRLQSTDAGGNEFFAFISDPDANFSIRHGATDQIVIFSQPVATGGILVPQSVTGAGGNSRVRTAPDKGALEEEYTFSSSTDTGSNPGSQTFRMNNVNPALVTEIAVHQNDLASQANFEVFWGPNLVAGDKIYISQPNFQSKWAMYELTGPPVDQTDWWNFPVSLIDNGTIFDNANLCRMAFSIANLGTGAFDPTANQTITGDWTFDNAAFDLKLGVSTSLHFRNPSDDSATFIQNLGPTFQFGIAGADFGDGIFELGVSWSHLKMNRSIVFDEQNTRPVVTVGGDGQIWVRDDVPNVLMFTDDADVDWQLNDQVTLVEKLVDPAGNDTVVAQGLGITAVRSVGNLEAEDRSVEWQHQDGTTQFSIGSEFFTDMILRNHITGRHIIFRVGIGGGNQIRLHLSGDQANGGASLYAGTSATPRLQSLNHGVEIGNGTLFLVEQAAQELDIAGQGQLWVNSADDSLNYVTEAGVNFDLTAGLAIPIVLGDDEQIQFGDGTDVTMDWNSVEFDISFAAAASPIQLRDGAQVRFMSPLDTSYTYIQQLADRTNILGVGVSPGFWQFNPELRILSGGLTFGIAGVNKMYESGGDMRLDLGTLGDFRIRGGNTGVDIMAEFNADAGVALYYNNARRFETVGIQVDGVISGAVLDDANGNMLHIGFQEQLWILQDTVLGTTSQEWRDAAGHILYSADAGAESYTTPASTDAVVPDGYWVDIVNLGAGAITVIEGVGVTLTHIDGVGATGSLVIAQFGKMRLHKRTGAAWYATNTVDVT